MNRLTTAISDFILTVSTLKCMSRQWDWEITERELQTAPVNPPATGIVRVKIKIGMNSWGNESLNLWASMSAWNHLFTNIWSTLVFSLIKSVYYSYAIGPTLLTTRDALCSSGYPSPLPICQGVQIGQDTISWRSTGNMKVELASLCPVLTQNMAFPSCGKRGFSPKYLTDIFTPCSMTAVERSVLGEAHQLLTLSLIMVSTEQ